MAFWNSLNNRTSVKRSGVNFLLFLLVFRSTDVPEQILRLKNPNFAGMNNLIFHSTNLLDFETNMKNLIITQTVIRNS
jgi:hypothetical protein